MTFRSLMTLGLALGLTACSGGKGTDTSATNTSNGDDDDNTNTITTAETGSTSDSYTTSSGGSTFEPKWLHVHAVLVIDGVNQVLATATDPNYTTASYTSFLELQLGDDAWTYAGGDMSMTGDYCVIDLPMTSSALAAWLPADAYYGVDYDGTDPYAAPITNCGDAQHPLTSGTTALTDAIINTAGPWGVGLGPPNSITAGTSLDGVAIGGLINSGAGLDPQGGTPNNPLGSDINELNHYFVQPFAIDENLVLEVDDQGYLVPIDPTAVFDGTSIASGLYILDDIFWWSGL